MELHLTRKDFKIEWFSGTGSGGQYRNKHQNCCRITHIETGLQAVATDRERSTNQRNAFNELTKRILNYYKRIEAESRIMPSTTVIRNYNESRNEVHDKSSGLKMPYKDIVAGNNIAPMIEARRLSMINGGTMFNKEDVLFQLTPSEATEVKSILNGFSEIFDRRLKDFGVFDMAPFFCNLIGEMVNFSLGDTAKNPEAFRASLKYHFGEEGEKFYKMTVTIFQEAFLKYQNASPVLVKVAIQLKLIELISAFPNDVMIEGENLYFRRKKKL